MIDQHAVRQDMPRLIGFAGAAGSGKTTAAHLLCDQGFTRMRFAGPIKAMLWALLNAAGRDGVVIDRMLEGDLKEEPSGLLGGRTPRQAMQTLGTQWGRDLITPDLFTLITIQGARVALRGGGRVVIDDVRFDSEVDAIRSEGGVVYRLVGRNDARVPDHVSERSVTDWDGMIKNDACKDQLEGNLLSLLLG